MQCLHVLLNSYASNNVFQRNALNEKEKKPKEIFIAVIFVMVKLSGSNSTF